MHAKYRCIVVFSLVLALLGSQARAGELEDLRQAIPQSSHFAVYGKRNPERDYQTAHYEKVWNTIQEERVVERFLDIVTKRASEGEIEKVTAVWEQLKAAVEPASIDALCDAPELVYCQVMETPFNHHVFVVRMASKDKAGYEVAANQLFGLIEEWSEGKVKLVDRPEGNARLLTLDIPGETPMKPVLISIDDVLIISSSETHALQSLALLQGKSGSKFDDPRLVEALKQLPEAEDAIVFFDGRTLFEQLAKIPDFIRAQAPAENEQVERWCKFVDMIIDEMAILDYEVTVEYTDGQQNRMTTIGKLMDDAEGKMLYQAVAQGEAFEDWKRWVPADAEAYSLCTGVNMHTVYQWLEQILRVHVPESHELLDKWEAKQAEFDFHLDRDLLQSFSGESISVTIPIEGADGSTKGQSVSAMRCSNPERVEELLKRGVNALSEFPALQAQQLDLVPSEELEGFHELKAASLVMFGVRPVIGFHDGWMITSGSPEAVKKVLATVRGEAETINDVESFRDFNVAVNGPVYSISYTDLGASIEQGAQTIEQIGVFGTMGIGMAAGKADPEKVAVIQEVFGLLPSIAKVVRSFDFMDDQLVVTQEGPMENTYRRDTVVTIKPLDTELD